jgi:serine/threonine protein kinase
MQLQATCRVDGRYEIVSPLGCGGIAEVYLARDLTLGRAVAIKVLGERYRTCSEILLRFEREADLAQRVIHPYVLQVLGSGRCPVAGLYLVSEVLLGETLRQYLEREGRMAPNLAIKLLRQAAAGLESTHREGVVHGDLKPDNLFLCGPVGNPRFMKIIDFGLARLMSERRLGEDLTVVGTVQYMSPEQVAGEPLDQRSDVYSLGVVLFRALTGELPFEGSPGPALLSHHLFNPAPPPSWLVDAVNADIDRVALTAMRKHPANRYPTMSDLGDDLERLLRQAPVTGSALVRDPDHYVPWSESGRRAMHLLSSTTGWALPESFDSEPRLDSVRPPPVAAIDAA